VQLPGDARALVRDGVLGGARALRAQRLGASVQEAVELAAAAHDAPGQHGREPEDGQAREDVADAVAVGIDGHRHGDRHGGGGGGERKPHATQVGAGRVDAEDGREELRHSGVLHARAERLHPHEGHHVHRPARERRAPSQGQADALKQRERDRR
jgi:hypothetical protein